MNIYFVRHCAEGLASTDLQNERICITNLGYAINCLIGQMKTLKVLLSICHRCQDRGSKRVSLPGKVVQREAADLGFEPGQPVPTYMCDCPRLFLAGDDFVSFVSTSLDSSAVPGTPEMP